MDIEVIIEGHEKDRVRFYVLTKQFTFKWIPFF